MTFDSITETLHSLWSCTMAWFSSPSAPMDLQTALICAGVFVISALVVYLISVFGMRERTYEEAIEEQRRRNQEAVQQAKSDKTKKEKKFKKWGRKSKDKGDDDKSSPSEDLSEEKTHHEHVEFKPEAELIPVEPDIETKLPKSKKKNKPLKPILINKEDGIAQVPSSSSDETDEQRSRSNSFSVSHPKDEVELKHSLEEASSIKDSPKPEEEKDLENAPSIMTQNDIKEEVPTHICEDSEIKESVVMVQSSVATGRSSPCKRSKKNKSEYLNTGLENSELSGNKVLSFLKTAILSDEEILMMIDVLANKQGGIGGWTKKNDPVAVLKKQLQEKEEALETEQRLSQAANGKLKDLRQELAQEKSRGSATERSLRDKVSQQQQELQTLHGRIQRSHDQHLADTAALQAKIQQLQTKLSEEHAIAVQRLQEDNSQLQQALTRLESEKQKRNSIEVSRLQHEAEQLRSARDQYETRQAAMQQAQDDLHRQIQQLEEHIEKLVSSHQDEEFGYKQRINEMSNKLQQAENARSSLVQELQNAQSVCSSLEADNSSLRQRLEEAKHQINSAENDMLQLQSRLEESHQQQRDLANCIEKMQSEVMDLTNIQNEHVQQIENLKQENESMASELAKTVQRMTADGAEALQQNGDVQEQALEKSNSRMDIEEREKMMQEKENLLQHIYEELDRHKSKIVLLSEEIEIQKQKNNELREKNWKAMEVLTAAEKEADNRLQEVLKTTEKRICDIQQTSEEKEKELQKNMIENMKELEQTLQKKYSTELDNKSKEIILVQKDAEEKISEAQRLANIRVEELQESLYRRLDEVHNEADVKVKEALKYKEDIISEIKALHKQEKETMKRIFPDINIDGQLDHSHWLVKFEDQAIKSIEKLKESSQSSVNKSNDVENLKMQLAETLEEKSKLEFHVHHYKTVLAETESILNNLQCSAETEEKIWKEKLLSKESDVNQILNENKKLTSEKKLLETKMEQLHGLEEMESALVELRSKLQIEEEEKLLLERKFNEVQTKLTELQSRLQVEEREKWLLEQKVEEANSNALDLNHQLEKKYNEMEFLQRESSASEDIRVELEQVKQQLEKERRISKELSAQAVNLSSLVKIGQSALQTEQKLVKDLQAQLQASTKELSTNGPPPLPSACTETSYPVSVSQVNSSSMPIKSEKRKKPRKRGASGKK